MMNTLVESTICISRKIISLSGARKRKTNVLKVGQFPSALRPRQIHARHTKSTQSIVSTPSSTVSTLSSVMTGLEVRYGSKEGENVFSDIRPRTAENVPIKYYRDRVQLMPTGSSMWMRGRIPRETFLPLMKDLLSQNRFSRANQLWAQLIYQNCETSHAKGQLKHIDMAKLSPDSITDWISLRLLPLRPLPEISRAELRAVLRMLYSLDLHHQVISTWKYYSLDPKLNESLPDSSQEFSGILISGFPIQSHQIYYSQAFESSYTSSDDVKDVHTLVCVFKSAVKLSHTNLALDIFGKLLAISASDIPQSPLHHLSYHLQANLLLLFTSILDYKLHADLFQVTVEIYLEKYSNCFTPELIQQLIAYINKCIEFRDSSPNLASLAEPNEPESDLLNLKENPTFDSKPESSIAKNIISEVHIVNDEQVIYGKADEELREQEKLFLGEFKDSRLSPQIIEELPVIEDEHQNVYDNSSSMGPLEGLRSRLMDYKTNFYPKKAVLVAVHSEPILQKISQSYKPFIFEVDETRFVFPTKQWADPEFRDWHPGLINMMARIELLRLTPSPSSYAIMKQLYLTCLENPFYYKETLDVVENALKDFMEANDFKAVSWLYQHAMENGLTLSVHTRNCLIHWALYTIKDATMAVEFFNDLQVAIGPQAGNVLTYQMLFNAFEQTNNSMAAWEMLEFLKTHPFSWTVLKQAFDSNLILALRNHDQANIRILAEELAVRLPVTYQNRWRPMIFEALCDMKATQWVPPVPVIKPSDTKGSKYL